MKTLLIGWLTLTFGWELYWQQSESATVIIYRQREFAGRDYDIFLNGKKLSYLSTNRYLRFDVPVGRVRLESKRDYYTENKTVTFTAEPGRTYYVKAIEEVDFLSQSLLMARVAEEQAKRELSRIKPLEPETNQKPE